MKKHATRVPVYRAFVLFAAMAVLTGWATPAPTSAAADGIAVEPPAPVAGDRVESTAEVATAAAFDAETWVAGETLSGLNPEVMRLAIGAANCAVKSGAVGMPKTLTVIDYSLPSTAKRMWVFDLESRDLLYRELVAHGQGTGENVATKFSNEPETHRTSIGLFVTQDTYVGRNGYSLRLNGLDRGFNDRARERAIVMHGAPYVNEQVTKSNGRLGRSWGCPAVRDAVARELIDRVKGGSLVFSYYPDAKWLSSSKYLGGCSSAN